MKRRATLVVVAVIASMIASATATVAAYPVDGGGSFGGSPPDLGIGLSISIPGASGNGHDSYSASDPRAPRPLYTRAIPATTGVGVDGLSNLCQIGPIDPAFPLANGWWFNIDVFVTATGLDHGTIGRLCVPFAPGAGGVAPPAPEVPQPPTIGEIWNAVGLPAPPIGVSPAAHGITGLPTWVWTRGSAPVGVAVGLAGYRITGTARVIGYGVFPGEGGWVRGRDPGGPGDPAFAHTYESTGTYRLGVATLWTAVAVMTGPGLTAPLTIDLGTAVVTNGRDYTVTQIRSRLVP